MKKICLYLLTIICFCSPCLAAGPEVMMGGGVAIGVSCNTTTPVMSAETRNDYQFLARTTNLFVATMIIPSSQISLCGISVNLLRAGSPSFTITVSIYSNNATPSDRPGSLIASATSSPIDCDVDIPDDSAYHWIYSSFNTTLSSSIKYWIVLAASSMGDSSNHIRVGDQTSYTDMRSALSTDGSTWSPTASYEFNFKAFANE